MSKITVTFESEQEFEEFLRIIGCLDEFCQGFADDETQEDGVPSLGEWMAKLEARAIPEGER